MKQSRNNPGFDWAKFEAMSDEDIEATSPPELANLPDDFFDAPAVVVRPAREAISLRVDATVLEFFRKDGPGYQSRMNAVLRRYVEVAAVRESASAPLRKAATQRGFGGAGHAEDRAAVKKVSGGPRGGAASGKKPKPRTRKKT